MKTTLPNHPPRLNIPSGKLSQTLLGAVLGILTALVLLGFLR